MKPVRRFTTTTVSACLCLLTALLLVTTACSGPSTKMIASPTTPRPDQPQPSIQLPHKKPTVIYLADFLIDPSIMTSSKDHRNGLVKKVLPKFRHDDQKEKAGELVAALSDSLRKELEAGGQNVQKIPGEIDHTTGLPQGVTLPGEGWLVGGWFVKVDEGDRAMSSAIGFGTGAEKVELVVLVTDLSNRSAGPFLALGSENGKKKIPGAVLTMNPYVLAAKFVMSSKTTERDTKKIGKSIAESLLEYIKPLPAGV